MKDKILQLVNTAFEAKKTHGANSQEFKDAQIAAFEEINRSYQKGACELIMTGEPKNQWGDDFAIRVEKKGDGALKCSYVRVRIQNVPYKSAIRGRKNAD